MIYSTPAQKNAFYFSALTHPLLMPVIGFLFFNKFNSTSFHGQSLFILLIVFSITVVLLPAYFVFSLKRSGNIQSYEMETLNERRLPLLFTTGTMLFNYYLMQRAHIEQLYQWYFLSVTAASVMALGISLFYKISLHTIGVGFLFGLGLILSYLSVSDMRWYLILIALLGGLVSYCRLVLLAHTLPQIYWGFLIGVLGSAGMILFI